MNTMNIRAGLLLLAWLLILPALAQEDIRVAPEVVPAEEYDPDEPFTIVEQMPEFPGGQEALMAYVGKKLKYPEEAVEAGIQGVVYVSFVVGTDGSISDAKVLRGIGGGCNEEAVRVVQGMPKWKPGMQRGKAVRVKYSLPIRYKLQEPKAPKE